ncbi:hypothetical protein CCHR01_03154 [Colletotrichum chrysophilum]|uniref:Uncharacterized protein n=1 Tax=Colletotrichum chrysophilum TaxID=1836956 RepID=A0AAD9AVJ8_9PEZI|nr:hypothetical protein CCHR01_03154 [Colletotrichum chrysophilum]
MKLRHWRRDSPAPAREPSVQSPFRLCNPSSTAVPASFNLPERRAFNHCRRQHSFSRSIDQPPPCRPSRERLATCARLESRNTSASSCTLVTPSTDALSARTRPVTSSTRTTTNFPCVHDGWTLRSTITTRRRLSPAGTRGKASWSTSPPRRTPSSRPRPASGSARSRFPT